MFESLQHFFGFTRFLDGQEEVVRRLLEGQDLCVVMPTGAGKSLCYQLPVLMRDGYGIVVSPLISLMKDQVDALTDRGIAAGYVNSSIPFDEQREVLNRAGQGALKLLYVAPERFRAAGFRALLEARPPATLVVDEAHCISQWGHDFRPDYARLGTAIAEIEVPQVCAFTATATPVVREDIRRVLGRDRMQTYVTGFQRPNLAFSVLDCTSAEDKLQTLARLLSPPTPTIIYSSTRKGVDTVADAFGCIGYHAGMSDSARSHAQEAFMADTCPVLVATNAFGMGIDRPDIRRVIHFNIPGSLEAYYQEAGRAGRDGEPADCVLLNAYSDRFIQEFLIELSNPDEALLRGLYALLLEEARRGEGGYVELTAATLAERVTGARSENQLLAALRILERHGCIERGYRRQNEGVLRIPGDLESLRLVNQGQETQRSRFLHRVARRFGDALHQGVSVSREGLAAVAGLRPEQVQRVLHALDGDTVLWTPPFSGRRTRVTDLEQKEPQVDFEALQRKKDLDLARLQGILDYARTVDCRQRFLVTYFGQEVGGWRCEACDYCVRMQGSVHRDASEHEQEIIRTVLRCVNSHNGRLGRGRIAKILAGSRSADVMERDLDTDPDYGALEKLGQSTLMRLLDALRRNGCLEVVGDPQYPCIAVTDQGLRVMRGREMPRIGFSLVETAPAKASGAGKGSHRRGQEEETGTGELEADRDLYERLRALRNDMAAERNVPVYRILENRALRTMAAEQPLTVEEAERIKGVGPVKLRTVVPRFLAEIKAWRREQGYGTG